MVCDTYIVCSALGHAHTMDVAGGDDDVMLVEHTVLLAVLVPSLYFCYTISAVACSNRTRPTFGLSWGLCKK